MLKVHRASWHDTIDTKSPLRTEGIDQACQNFGEKCNTVKRILFPPEMVNDKDRREIGSIKVMYKNMWIQHFSVCTDQLCLLLLSYDHCSLPFFF